MTDLDALLAEIIAHPAEDTPRLAYADCLEEQGDDWYAQFIRDQIAGVPRAVPRSAVVPLEPLVGLCVGTYPDGGIVTGHGSAVFRRGFADEVTCPAGNWLAHGHAARRLYPITRVNLTTWYPEYRASCDALAACYPGVAFTLPEPLRPVAAALEQSGDDDRHAVRPDPVRRPADRRGVPRRAAVRRPDLPRVSGRRA